MGQSSGDPGTLFVKDPALHVVSVSLSPGSELRDLKVCSFMQIVLLLWAWGTRGAAVGTLELQGSVRCPKKQCDAAGRMKDVGNGIRFLLWSRPHHLVSCVTLGE